MSPQEKEIEPGATSLFTALFSPVCTVYSIQGFSQETTEGVDLTAYLSHIHLHNTILYTLTHICLSIGFCVQHVERVGELNKGWGELEKGWGANKKGRQPFTALAKTLSIAAVDVPYIQWKPLFEKTSLKRGYP